MSEVQPSFSLQTALQLTFMNPQALLERDMLSYKPLDSEVQELKKRYFADSQPGANLELYVPAKGMATQHAPEEEHFGLWEHLEQFLAPESPQKVCLILGAACAGKSTFNHFITTRLWEAYDKDSFSNEGIRKRIPVFIPLADLHDPTHRKQDLIAEFFKERNWSEERILKARKQLEFVFILDGYDEIEQRIGNFYFDNGLANWNAKTVITSRPECLGPGYEYNLHPLDQPQLLKEMWLAPFSTKDITEYISRYVQLVIADDPPEGPPSRSVKDYEQLVERPELRALISNPFLLKIAMTAQPSIGEANIKFKRVTLYRAFFHDWLQSARSRLLLIQIPSDLHDSFTVLDEEGFTKHAESYCLGLAVELYRHKSLEVSYFPAPRPSATKQLQNAIWGRFLSYEGPKTRLLRYSSPLIRVGQSYHFLHRSLRDFAVAQAIWQDEDLCSPSALLNEFSLVDDYGIIDFIVEEAEQNEMLKARLQKCVEESEQNPEVAIAVANATTILARAKQIL